MSKPLLSLRDLRVTVDTHEVVHGIDLEIPSGEIHAIMGPNGSGKSSLVHALMGHPAYGAKGKALLQGTNLLSLDPSARAALGLFLAFQYPRELAGVTLRSFLFSSLNALHASDPKRARLSPLQLRIKLGEQMANLHLDPSFAERSLNQGFSGGEKKKAEVLQMLMLQPAMALLDETDSGLDIDALKVVGKAVNSMRSKSFSALVVTHYARLLDEVKPDRVHVMVRGRIVESGGPKLAEKLEREGYAQYGVYEEENRIPLTITRD